MKNTPLSHFSPFLIFLALSFCFALVLSGLVRFLFFLLLSFSLEGKRVIITLFV